MSYDDVEIEDMEWNEELQAYTYPCPCGDLFQITKEDLKLGEEIARCPSCSLYITVVYNIEDFLADSDQNRRNKGIQPSKQQTVTVAWISGNSLFLVHIYFPFPELIVRSAGRKNGMTYMFLYYSHACEFNCKYIDKENCKVLGFLWKHFLEKKIKNTN